MAIVDLSDQTTKQLFAENATRITASMGLSRGEVSVQAGLQAKRLDDLMRTSTGMRLRMTEVISICKVLGVDPEDCLTKKVKISISFE